MPDHVSLTKSATQATPGPSCTEITVIALTSRKPSVRSTPNATTQADAPLWILDLSMPGWGRWKPGQFVMLRPAAWGYEPLWARPLSICMAEDKVLRVFFQGVGRGTTALTRLAPGERVVIWGPLGTSFAVKTQTPTLLLAGGMGLAPFIGYARLHPEINNLHLILGHRQDQACYPLELLPDGLSREILRQQTPEELHAFGHDLAEKIQEYAALDGLVLACGPLPFLRVVHGLALEHGVKTQLSLENRMACGVGACLGCVTDAAQGLPLRVCNQGPVFWAADIRL